jgi:hypothetical protein
VNSQFNAVWKKVGGIVYWTKKPPLDEPPGIAESTNHPLGDREEEKDGIFFAV